MFDRDSFTQIQELMPPPAEFDQLVQSDSQLHQDAASRAAVAPRGPEPVSFVYAQFERDLLPLRRVAAELSVSVSDLTAALPRLDRLALQAEEERIDRSTLSELFVTSMCTLHAASLNRPAVCP